METDIRQIRVLCYGMNVFFRKLGIGAEQMKAEDNTGKIAVCFVI